MRSIKTCSRSAPQIGSDNTFPGKTALPVQKVTFTFTLFKGNTHKYICILDLQSNEHDAVCLFQIHHVTYFSVPYDSISSCDMFEFIVQLKFTT